MGRKSDHNHKGNGIHVPEVMGNMDPKCIIQILKMDSNGRDSLRDHSAQIILWTGDFLGKILSVRISFWNALNAPKKSATWERELLAAGPHFSTEEAGGNWIGQWHPAEAVDYKKALMKKKNCCSAREGIHCGKWLNVHVWQKTSKISSGFMMNVQAWLTLV